jgi:hypothetical protein
VHTAKGSVFDPTLFLIFINDKCDVVSDLNVTIKMFADDATFYSVLDLGQAGDLYTACNRIVYWAENWQLRIANKQVPCTAYY